MIDLPKFPILDRRPNGDGAPSQLTAMHLMTCDLGEMPGEVLLCFRRAADGYSRHFSILLSLPCIVQAGRFY
jgi:hypothetical protein